MRNLMDAVAFLLIITSAILAAMSNNWSASIAWVVAAIWLIRCKLTELQ